MSVPSEYSEEVRMVKAALAAEAVDFEAIDRLEQKLKMLVSVLDRTRADYARANEENVRLRGELDTVRDRLTAAESAGGELATLRTEREQIRSRVDDMLRQIESLNL